MRLGARLVNGVDGKSNIKDAEEWRLRPGGGELALGARKDDEVVAVAINRRAKEAFDAEFVDSEKVGVTGVFDLSHSVDVFGGEPAGEGEVGDFCGVTRFPVAVAEQDERDARDGADAGAGAAPGEAFVINGFGEDDAVLTALWDVFRDGDAVDDGAFFSGFNLVDGVFDKGARVILKGDPAGDLVVVGLVDKVGIVIFIRNVVGGGVELELVVFIADVFQGELVVLALASLDVDGVSHRGDFDGGSFGVSVFGVGEHCPHQGQTDGDSRK